jgi:hypothetical protein
MGLFKKENPCPYISGCTYIDKYSASGEPLFCKGYSYHGGYYPCHHYQYLHGKYGTSPGWRRDPDL